MDSLPLVSIICLCYNQKRYVSTAIRSALNQTYENIELIVVDDASSDGSQDEIRSALQGTEITFIPLERNVGNCNAFNIGFKKSKGQFIIDLAADDALMPMRVEQGINDFLIASEKTGVHFSDVFLSDSDGQILGTHYSRDENGQIVETIPQGDIYFDLIARYFISPPSMLIKREVLEKLNGYDETLSYEDFDFWIRSSRKFEYIFNKAPLMKKRILQDSHSTSQKKVLNSHQESTLKVCQKIYDLNKKPEEYLQLIKRCRYEMKHSLLTLNIRLIPKYQKLIKQSKAAYRRLSSPSSIEI